VYVEQNTDYKTDFKSGNTGNTPSNSSDGGALLSHEERQVLIDVDEEHQRGESSAHGEIRGALLQSLHEEELI
jgi:hypothetical protein